MRFGREVEPSIHPYETLERVGNVAYHLDLLTKLGEIHPAFYVSMLRKYLPDPSHVIRPQEV